MASAIQLVDPNGVVRAWMCGTCFHVGAAGTYLGKNADERIASASKMRAESCCVCASCGKSRPREGRVSFLECAECAEKRRLAEEAERAAKMLTHDQCAECEGDGVGLDYEDCTACGASGWVAKAGAK